MTCQFNVRTSLRATVWVNHLVLKDEACSRFNGSPTAYPSARSNRRCTGRLNNCNRRQIARCVDVGVGLMTAGNAPELQLRPAAGDVDDPACVARAAGVARIDHDELAALAFGLVGELAAQFIPSDVQGRAVQARLGLHVLSWRLLRPLGTARHIAYTQVLDRDDAVAFGVAVRDVVQEVSALATNEAVYFGDACFGLVLSYRWGALGFAGQLALCPGQQLARSVEVPRVGDEVALAVGHRCNYSHVEADNTYGVRVRRHLFRQPTGDRHEPLVDLAGDADDQGLADDAAVSSEIEVSQPRKTDAFSADATALAGWDAHRRPIAPRLALEAGHGLGLTEEIFPSGVEASQQVRLKHLRYVAQPVEFGAASCEFLLLIEAGQPALARATRTPQPLHTLRMRRVPQRTLCALPELQGFGLGGVGVRTEAVSCDAVAHWVDGRSVMPVLQYRTSYCSITARATPPLPEGRGFRRSAEAEGNARVGLIFQAKASHCRPRDLRRETAPILCLASKH